jgi:L-amino acid N-acyltransferase YncA
MPDEHLDGLPPEEQAAGWERGLSRDQDPVLVAEEVGRVVGFAVVGPAQDPEGAGELYAINVDLDHWWTGVGRAAPAAPTGSSLPPAAW